MIHILEFDLTVTIDSSILNRNQLLITGNENALNFADIACAIGIQRGSSATDKHWTDSLQLPYSQNYGAP